MNQIELELKEATTQWVNKANQVFGKNLKTPIISLNLKGCCAGRAYYSQWLIKYNPDIYIHNKEDFVNRTVPHELAHLIARQYGMVKPHGNEWRLVMIRLGVKDVTRCHNYNMQGVRGVNRPFVYACSCQEYKVTRCIHSKMLMGQVRYCRKCRQNIVYKRTDMVS